MPVRWDTFDISLFAGVDTRTDGKVLSGKLADLQNAVFDAKVGALGKRKGYDELTAGAPAEARMLKARGDQLVLGTSQKIYTYSEQDGATSGTPQAGWVERSNWRPLGLTLDPIAQSGRDQIRPAMTVFRGLEFYAWEDTADAVWYGVYEAATESWILGPKQLATNTRWPCLARVSPKYVCLFYHDTAGTAIKVKVWDAENVRGTDANAAVTISATDVNTATPIDACDYDATRCLVAYVSNDATAQYRVRSFNPATSAVALVRSGAAPTGAVWTGCIAITGDHDGAQTNPDVGVMYFHNWAANLGIRGVALERLSVAGTLHRQATATYTGAADRDRALTCTCSFNGSDLVGFHDHLTNTTPVRVQIRRGTIGPAAGYTVTEALNTLWLSNATIGSKPFQLDGRFYLHTRSAQEARGYAEQRPQLFASYYLVDSATKNPAAKLLPLKSPLHGPIRTTAGAASWSTAIDDAARTRPTDVVYAPAGTTVRITGASKVRYAALPYRNRLRTNIDYTSSLREDDVFAHNSVARTVYAADAAISAQEIDGNLYASGAMLWEIDGEGANEAGFLEEPILIGFAPTVAAHGAAGTALGAGTYTYAVYPEWYSPNGTRSQGTCIGTFQAVTTTGDDQVTISFATLAHTWRHLGNGRPNMSLAVYRSTANGVARYRVSSLDPTQSSGDNRYLANNFGAVSLSFVDALNDADLVNNEPDYRNPDPVDNFIGASLRHLRFAQGRLWGVSNEDRRRVYYSKLKEDGVGLCMSDGLFVDFPEDISGIGTVNDQMVAWSRNRLYLIQGRGPDNFGNGEYADPVELRSGYGVENPRALANTPAGWVFESSQGIGLLEPGLGAGFVGADVKSFTDSQETSAATALEGVNQVRFLAATGRSLVWDYERQFWSTFPGVAGVDATVWRGAYSYAEADGTVRVESSQYLDGAGTYAMQLTTGWIRPANLIGYARIRRLAIMGTRLAAHKLRIEVGYNDDESTWVDNVLVNDPTYPIRHRFLRQKVHSFRLRLTEVAPDAGTLGNSFLLNGLAIEVGFRRGLARLSPARTV